MIHRRAGLALAAIAAVGATGTAVAGASTYPGNRHDDPVPTTMTGQKIAAQPQSDRPGTVLTGKFVSYPRVFASSQDGLAIGGDKLGNEYAAITTNGGATWKVASPALFTPTLDAPNAISAVATAGSSIDIVYGAECIDVTDNGGVSWYRVYPDGYVTAVFQGLHGIAADVQIVGDNDKILATDEYVSSDAGKHWKLESILGG